MTTWGISNPFELLSPSSGQVTNALLTRSPLRRYIATSSPFDLHVLGTPPAFILSQDQTLRKNFLALFSEFFFYGYFELNDWFFFLSLFSCQGAFFFEGYILAAFFPFVKRPHTQTKNPMSFQHRLPLRRVLPLLSSCSAVIASLFLKRVAYYRPFSPFVNPFEWQNRYQF